MKFTVICDKKPEACESCFFHGEAFQHSDEGSAVIKYCVLTGFKDPITACPLIEASIVSVKDDNDD